MFDEFKQYLAKKRFGAVSIAALAFSLSLISYVLASELRHAVVPGTEGSCDPVHLSSEAPTAPASFAALAETLAPTVVNIKVKKVEKAAIHLPQAPEGPFKDFFERFFKEIPKLPDKSPAQGTGSGVIISDDGYILTNNHVVVGAKEVTATLSDKQEHEARIVGRDPKTDLAVLKIEAAEPLPTARMGDSGELKVGDWVMAIGNPFGLNHTVTSGIVSAKGRVIGAGPYDDFIQTDASINPGNSGGPLFNMGGELVGINTAILPYGQGIGFAIPVNTAKPLIPQLVSKGEVTRGYLGVTIQPITPELAKALKLDDRRGALVADVMSGSPAEEAGIRRGDVIMAFNDEEVEDARDLSAMVAKASVHRETTVTVLRDGQKVEMPVKIGKMENEAAQVVETAEPSKAKWGLYLQNVNPPTADKLGLTANEGVLIADVEPGSPADRAGIQDGDIILEVNRKPVRSVKETKEVMDRADDKDSLLLLVKRDEANFFVVLKG